MFSSVFSEMDGGYDEYHLPGPSFLKTHKRGDPFPGNHIKRHPLFETDVNMPSLFSDALA